ncbi:MAG: ATP-grasp domain-containing protein [Pseudomonadales bacterium]|nr:ATP-grasp domain-containing protein [Pseudomonadales bacterium]
MRIPVVIVLGSSKYISDYASYLKADDPEARLLVIDKYKVPKTLLPENAIYFASSLKNTLSKIVSYSIKNKLTVKGVVNRTDYFEVLHGQLCETFNVPGPTASSVQDLADKTRMHELMIQSELSFFRPRTIITTLNEVSTYFDQLQFPIVLKTHLGAKSRGVVTLKNAKGFEVAKEILLKYIENPDKDLVLIEQYLYGKQVAPVMYVDKIGKVRVLALVDVITAREVKQNHMQLIYRTTPSRHSENIRQKITFVMQTLVDASGLKSTLLHPEFFVIGKHIFLIEVNVRMGGFRDVIMRNAYNIDMNKLSWELALDMRISDNIKESSSCTACEVWESESGKVEKFSIPKSKYIISETHYIKPGDKYIAPPNAQKPFALFYVKSPDDSLSVAKNLRKKTIIKFKNKPSV